MAQREFDLGAMHPEAQLDHMILNLKPSAAQQAQLDALVAAQHDPHSPLYRQWLTAAQYGARFGASAADLAKVTGWLASHGFQVEETPPSNRIVIFSGSAQQVQEAFHTEMHRYQVHGVAHIANQEDPQIPAALSGVVGGVVSLHDFRRSSAIRSRTLAAVSAPQYSNGSTHYLFPADWATIYDLNALYSAGTNGSGSSIAIVGRSNINLTDVASFRSASGLPVNNPTVILVSTNPGLVSGDQDESTLDVEWSGAVAPAATVKFVVGASTATSDGVDLSAQYIVNHQTATVVSTSYGSCEQDMGSSELAFYNSLWQQAASQGMSALISSGDSGAAGCYGGSSTSASGTGVNGLCSSTYSTCVGGTEFNEGSNNSQYWAASNSTSYESALSYIPEVVWNESALDGGSGLWSSGGGASLTYQQPSWQKNVTGTAAANGMRAVPDVAMSASGHDGYIIVEDGNFYVIAGTSAASPAFAGVMALVVQSQGGKGQGNANPTLYPLLNAAHNPFHATPSGNNSVPGVTGFPANGASYNLATGLGSVDGAVLVHSWPGATTSKVDFALSASSPSGSLQTGKSTSFTVSVAESGTAKSAVALTAAAVAGVTVTISPASILPGTTATVNVTVATTAAAGARSIVITGTDASGTGSATYALTVTVPPTLTLTASSSTVAAVQGAAGTLTLSAATGGSFTGGITFTLSGLPTGVTAKWSANPIATASATNAETLTLTAASTATVASSSLTITAAGAGLTSSVNATLQVQSAAAVVLSVAPTAISMNSTASNQATFTATPAGGLIIPAAAAGSTITLTSGLPKGFTAAWSPAAITASGTAVWTLTLTGSSTAEAGTSSLLISAKVVAKSGVSYPSTVNLPLTVIVTPPTLTIAPATSTPAVVQGRTVTDSIVVTGNSTYSGAVSLSTSGLPSGVTAAWSTNPLTLSSEKGASTLTLTATTAAAVASSTITITASGDGITATKQITLQVQQAPGLQLAVSPASVSMQSVSSATVTVTATPLGGVGIASAGTVSKQGQPLAPVLGNKGGSGLYAVAVPETVSTGPSISVTSVLPKGVTASFSTATVNPAGAAVWTLTLTGSSASVASSTTLALAAQVTDKTSGSAYSATASLPLTVTVTPPTLTVTSASTSLSVTRGKSESSSIAVSGNSTYAGAVTLSVSGLPSGVTAGWSTNPLTLTALSGASTLTLTASATATVGAATITVTATGDGVSASQKLTLTVVASAPPTLTVTPAASTMTVINPVEATTATQSIASQIFSFAGGGSYSGSVTLSVSGLPANLSATWSSSPVVLNSANTGSSTLTIQARAVSQNGATVTVPPGSYTITVTAVGDGLTVTKTIVIQVEGAVVTPSVTALSIHRGTKGSFSFTATSMGGATGFMAPSLSANAAPNGIVVSASPTMIAAPGPGTVTFTLTVSSTAALTTYQLLPAVVLLPSATSTTPILVGWSTAPVTLTIVQ